MNTWVRSRAMALLIRVAIAIVIVGAAVWWRASKYVLGSSARVGQLLVGRSHPWSFIDLCFDVATLAVAALGIRAAIVHAAFWRKHRKVPTPNARNAILVSDAPVTRLSDDELSRASFVDTVLTTLLFGTSDRSTVVGIEGRWGEGKTSVLRLVASGLNAQTPHPIVVWFDPWPEESKRGVVARLLDDIAYQIAQCPDISPRDRKSATRSILAIADAVGRDLGATYALALRSFIRWLYPRITGLTTESIHSISANRDLIESTLARLPCRLVVMVDDLDRVDAEELRAVLMAVNALSHLPNTSVLLAFDPEVVDSQLSIPGLKNAGVPFREKVVNVTLPLPTAAFADRLRLFKKAFYGGLQARGLETNWHEWDAKLRDRAEILATRMLTSPRALKRLANHACVVLESVRTEVNGADILVLELIRILFPLVWGFIREHQNHFDPFDAYDEGYIPEDRDPRVRVPSSATKEDRRAPRVLLDNAASGASDQMRPQARQLLGILFPLADMREVTTKIREALQRDGRVAVGDTLRLYFSLGVAGTAIPRRDIHELLRETEGRAAILENYQSGGLLASFASTVAAYVAGRDEIPDLDQLVIMLMKAVRVAWAAHGENACDEVAELILRLLAADELSRRVFLLGRIMRSEESICVSHDVLLALLRHANLWDNGVLFPKERRAIPRPGDPLVSDDELLRLKDTWVETAWQFGLARLFHEEPEPMSVLYRLGQLEGPQGNDFGRIREALGEFISSDSNLTLLVKQFSPQMTGRPTAVQGLEKLIPDWESFIQRVRELGEPSDAIYNLTEYTPPMQPAT